MSRAGTQCMRRGDCAVIGFSPERRRSVVEKWEITIPELTGETKRRAYVYLPSSYETRRNRRYPVLYMFDGHNVFFDEDATYGKSWGMKDYLDRTHTQIIVAAVECSHSPDNGRLREYSPFTFSDPEFGSVEGLGDVTMNWLVRTFKPGIDSAYRTMPERRTTWIAGSSMGGLMSLYALIKYNAVFSRAAALSPSLWTAPEKLIRMIDRAKPRAGTVLYMDAGSKEIGTRQDLRQIFARVSAHLVNRQVLLTSRIVPGGSHCEASWEKQIPFFINVLQYQ